MVTARTVHKRTPSPLPTLPPRKTEHLVLLGSTELFRIGKPYILGQGCLGCFFAWLGFIFMVLRYGVKNIPPSAYFWEAHVSQCLGLSVCLFVPSLGLYPSLGRIAILGQSPSLEGHHPLVDHHPQDGHHSYECHDPQKENMYMRLQYNLCRTSSPFYSEK